MFSCEYCETFKDTDFVEHLRWAASCFMKKNKHSRRLAKSSTEISNQ